MKLNNKLFCAACLVGMLTGTVVSQVGTWPDPDWTRALFAPATHSPIVSGVDPALAEAITKGNRALWIPLPGGSRYLIKASDRQSGVAVVLVSPTLAETRIGVFDTGLAGVLDMAWSESLAGGMRKLQVVGVGNDDNARLVVANLPDPSAPAPLTFITALQAQDSVTRWYKLCPSGGTTYLADAGNAWLASWIDTDGDQVPDTASGFAPLPFSTLGRLGNAVHDMMPYGVDGVSISTQAARIRFSQHLVVAPQGGNLVLSRVDRANPAKPTVLPSPVAGQSTLRVFYHWTDTVKLELFDGGVWTSISENTHITSIHRWTDLRLTKVLVEGWQVRVCAKAPDGTIIHSRVMTVGPTCALLLRGPEYVQSGGSIFLQGFNLSGSTTQFTGTLAGATVTVDYTVMDDGAGIVLKAPTIAAGTSALLHLSISDSRYPNTAVLKTVVVYSN